MFEPGRGNDESTEKVGDELVNDGWRTDCRQTGRQSIIYICRKLRTGHAIQLAVQLVSVVSSA